MVEGFWMNSVYQLIVIQMLRIHASLKGFILFLKHNNVCKMKKDDRVMEMELHLNIRFKEFCAFSPS